MIFKKNCDFLSLLFNKRPLVVLDTFTQKQAFLFPKAIWSAYRFLSTRSTLHGYLIKILARSCQDLGKILAKIVTRYCQELQDAMVRSYQESHVSKKNLTKKPNMARKI